MRLLCKFWPRQGSFFYISDSTGFTKKLFDTIFVRNEKKVDTFIDFCVLSKARVHTKKACKSSNIVHMGLPLWQPGLQALNFHYCYFYTFSFLIHTFLYFFSIPANFHLKKGNIEGSNAFLKMDIFWNEDQITKMYE